MESGTSIPANNLYMTIRPLVRQTLMTVDQVPRRRQQTLHDHLDTILVGMDQIALVERWIERDAVEENGYSMTSCFSASRG